MLVYIPNRDPEDPTKFFIYEQYVDEAAYTAHTETEHFKTPRLRRRDPAPAGAQARVLRADERLTGRLRRGAASCAGACGGRVACAAMPKRVLVVDDHPRRGAGPEGLPALGRPLRGLRQRARPPPRGCALLGGQDAVLLDLYLPDMSGLELVQAFRDRGPGAKLILHSAADDTPEVDAVRPLVDAVVAKSGFTEMLGRSGAADRCMRPMLRRQ